MKIEVGKEYAMANGQVATIMEFRPGAAFPFMGSFGSEGNGGTMSWNADGEQVNAAQEYRLVAEHVPPPPAIKLELGKKYVTRDGRVTSPINEGKTETYSTFRDQFHQFGASILTHDGDGPNYYEWRGDGRFDDTETPLDLVSEYVEAVATDAAKDFISLPHGAPELLSATLDDKDSPAAKYFDNSTVVRTGQTDGEIIERLSDVMMAAQSSNQRTAVAAWFNARYGQ